MHIEKKKKLKDEAESKIVLKWRNHLYLTMYYTDLGPEGLRKYEHYFSLFCKHSII